MTRIIPWILLGLFWWSLAGLRHLAGQSATYDLGHFEQLLWNWTHGFGPISSIKMDVPIWKDHQSPVLALWVPLYWLIPKTQLLLATQALGVALGGLALQSFSKPLRWTWVLPLLFVLSKPIRAAVLFDFHPEVLFFTFSFVWAVLWKKGSRWNLLFWVLALGTRETAGIGLLMALAVFEWQYFSASRGRPIQGPWAKARLKHALGLAGITLLWMCFCYFVLARGPDGKHPYAGLYAGWGVTPLRLLLLPWERPGALLRHFLVPERIGFLLKLFASVGFLPLFSKWGRVWSLATLASLWPALLADGVHRMNINYHYGIEPSFLLFLGAGATLEHWSKGTQKPDQKSRGWKSAALGIALLVAALRSQALHLPEGFRWAKEAQHPEWAALRDVYFPKLRATVPAERSLAVPERWGPWFSQRRFLRLPGAHAECQIRELKSPRGFRLEPSAEVGRGFCGPMEDQSFGNQIDLSRPKS